MGYVSRVDVVMDFGTCTLCTPVASVLLDAGEDIKALSKQLGHSGPGFALPTYTHLLPSCEPRTHKAIDDAFMEPET